PPRAATPPLPPPRRTRTRYNVTGAGRPRGDRAGEAVPLAAGPDGPAGRDRPESEPVVVHFVRLSPVPAPVRELAGAHGWRIIERTLAVGERSDGDSTGSARCKEGATRGGGREAEHPLAFGRRLLPGPGASAPGTRVAGRGLPADRGAGRAR